jgi:hypothetical protein
MTLDGIRNAEGPGRSRAFNTSWMTPIISYVYPCLKPPLLSLHGGGYMGNGGGSRMAKVVFKKLQGSTARKIGAKGTAVKTERVSGADGKKTTVRKLDSASGSFGADFTWVFGANVKKARQENKRLTGALDRAPAAG